MAAALWSDRYSVLAALFVDQIEPGLHLYSVGAIVLNKRQPLYAVSCGEKKGLFSFLMIHLLPVLLCPFLSLSISLLFLMEQRLGKKKGYLMLPLCSFV